MSFKRFQCEYKENRYIIEEESSEVGWYLYVFSKSGNCIADYLQDDFESVVEFANDEFQVPKEKWRGVNDKTDDDT